VNNSTDSGNIISLIVLSLVTLLARNCTVPVTYFPRPHQTLHFTWKLILWARPLSFNQSISELKHFVAAEVVCCC